MIGLISVLALIGALAADAASLVYKASCTSSSVVPPTNTKASGSATVTLINSSYASGYFYATNINQMTMAHLHAGAVGKNGPIITWAFNATYGPLSGSIKASFTFNPSVKNVSALLAAGLVYFNIHTVAYPAGELRGQLIGPGNVSYPSPAQSPPPSMVSSPPPSMVSDSPSMMVSSPPPSMVSDPPSMMVSSPPPSMMSTPPSGQDSPPPPYVDSPPLPTTPLMAMAAA